MTRRSGVSWLGQASLAEARRSRLSLGAGVGADAAQRPQVDQDIDERVLVGDRALVTQEGALDAEFFGLRVDALIGGLVFEADYYFCLTSLTKVL